MIPPTDSIEALAERFDIARSEAARLAAHALGMSPAWAVAHDGEPLSGAQAARVIPLFRARSEGVPFAYITGAREFYGLALAVTPRVLIPRPETELLVDLALERLRGWAPGNGCSIARPPRVLDLGTGSGALAIAVAVNCPVAEVWASDRSPGAIAVARDNAQRHGAQVRFVEGDWFSGLAQQSFNIVLCNPPYVAEGDPHLAQGDLRFEPHEALCGGHDGLAAVRAVANAAPLHIVPGGWLLLEHGCDQAGAVSALLNGSRWEGVSCWRDLAGHERVTGARRRADAQRD